MTRQENGRGILDTPPLMRRNGLESTPGLLAMLHFDEGDQPATPRDDVKLARRGRIAPRQDAPAREPEAQRAESLRRKPPRVCRATFL